ncbi:RNA polymerase sigma-70 factor, ECF subfamily [Mucilaginibacter pineti]|uniref:RNA polymerase sigma-70 factor, ECF subfamily n=1 Tax=Mucilaginibacter pineti TaxID=1391627 RepID=A0A1G7ESA2_9SPHI|nr:RNA polymerase sigma-70 factor [Mucilaginibacter pineti]SDE66507.1 RNA polymerase sigma-70 factor, ECF subfamily [Mucilaginibacter pineti]
MGKYSAASWTDDILLDLIRLEDDRAAFSELYDRYWDKIFLQAANALNSAEEAKECVQDIFCSLWSRRQTLELKYSLYTYLAVAVKYRVINILNSAYYKRHRKTNVALDEIEIYSPSAETELLEKELFASLERSVNLLPEKCQLVFRMSREENKTHRQIAEELNISEKTVNNHLTKAIKDLSTNLSTPKALFILGESLHRLF